MKRFRFDNFYPQHSHKLSTPPVKPTKPTKPVKPTTHYTYSLYVLCCWPDLPQCLLYSLTNHHSSLTSKFTHSHNVTYSCWLELDCFPLKSSDLTGVNASSGQWNLLWVKTSVSLSGFHGNECEFTWCRRSSGVNRVTVNMASVQGKCLKVQLSHCPDLQCRNRGIINSTPRSNMFICKPLDLYDLWSGKL